jgi:hypothetical protein
LLQHFSKENFQEERDERIDSDTSLEFASLFSLNFDGSINILVKKPSLRLLSSEKSMTKEFEEFMITILKVEAKEASKFVKNKSSSFRSLRFRNNK